MALAIASSIAFFSPVESSASFADAVYEGKAVVEGIPAYHCGTAHEARTMAERGGRNGKKRAIIATARKLAVLLHRLWVSGEVYEPFHNNSSTLMATA